MAALVELFAQSPLAGAAIAAGFLGLAAGWLIERSHFCTMGAISDAYLFGSWRRLRAWGLAVASALLASQLLAALGLLPLARSLYLAVSPALPGLFFGGLLFGIGMVLAGGCVSRNLVRLGSGSLKALVVLLILAVVAAATEAALPGWAVGSPGDAAPAGVAGQSLGGLLALAGLGPAPRLDRLIALGLGSAILLFVFKDAVFRRNRRDVGLGLGLGVSIALGFVLTLGLVAGDDAARATSLTYVAPAAEGLRRLTGSQGIWPGFLVALAAGTVLGAALSAFSGKRLRLETFVSRDDMIRHVAGAAMMGVGGVLALGCTVGQGMSGLATLSAGSFVASAGIVVGALLALRRLELGTWRAALGLGRPDALDGARDG